jgi:hypothetical protein
MVYMRAGLPPPTLIVSKKALEDIQNETEYTCRCDANGVPTFLGMRWMLDSDRLAGWELREDFGNR